MVLVRCQSIFTPVDAKLCGSDEGRKLIKSARHELRSINHAEIGVIIAEFRHFGFVAVRNGDNRRELRRRQRDARLVYAPRRFSAAPQHPERQSDFRRRGRGTLRHADVRHSRGFHRRVDGGPHARIPRQKIHARDNAIVRRALGYAVKKLDPP